MAVAAVVALYLGSASTNFSGRAAVDCESYTSMTSAVAIGGGCDCVTAPARLLKSCPSSDGASCITSAGAQRYWLCVCEGSDTVRAWATCVDLR